MCPKIAHHVSTVILWEKSKFSGKKQLRVWDDVCTGKSTVLCRFADLRSIPRNHSGGREPAPKNCLLTSAHTP